MKMDDLQHSARRPLSELEQHRGFVDRHIGTSDADQAEMLRTLGLTSRAALIDEVMRAAIRSRWAGAGLLFESLPIGVRSDDAVEELGAVVVAAHPEVRTPVESHGIEVSRCG